jgi:hypothetical protein
MHNLFAVLKHVGKCNVTMQHPYIHDAEIAIS